MDLGRVVCTPKQPLCGKCPIQSTCCAFKSQQIQIYPVKSQKQKPPHYQVVIGLIQKKGTYLIQRRPETGLLGGLWEFPGGKINQGESEVDALKREIEEETSLQVEVGEKITTIQHAYTHFKITLSAYRCKWLNGEAQKHVATENKWVTPDKFKDHAFPKANLKILEVLE
jgi:A/G-specific adenine glycosylase